MVRFKDLTGQRFGKWTVISRAENRCHHTYWLCRCDCGTEKAVNQCNLVKGVTTSCGCYNKEKANRKTHGLSKHRLYRIYQNMKNRCYRKNDKYYSIYGGRGIKICDEWLNDFAIFAEWALNNGYADTLSIDRINTNGNYEPSNCRWIDNFEQSNNRRTTRQITYNGETHTVREWAKITGIKYEIINDRLKRKWDINRVFNQPIRSA